MSGWLQALILGVLQGLTEFLPVSSSGHLVMLQTWLGKEFVFLEQAIAFDLVLHLGTLLPVLWFYRKEIAKILKALVSELPWKHEGGAGSWLRNNEERWLAAMVILAMIPTGAMGVGLKDLFKSLFHNITSVCIALFVTGCVLFATRFFGGGEKSRIQPGHALLIGIAQGIAITPGISRSGSTIATALLLGLNRELAARFSFLLSIPTILGAVVLTLKDGVNLDASAAGALAVGFFSSMLVGYAALVMLVALVKKGGLHNFSYYLWPISIIAWLMLSGA